MAEPQSPKNFHIASDGYNYLNPPLSTKREKQLRGIKQKRESSVARSIQSLNRYRISWGIHGPKFISFATEKGVAFDMECAYYNEDDPREYFDQCFETERKIGEGSFGEVFRVKSKIDGKHYAVKRTIEPFRNPSDRDLKLREVQKHELIPRHPNLVEFVSAWEENGRLFIQTELCDYSLADLAERLHHIPEEDVWGYFADMVAAVHHLHQLDILHLDIKPENIFVSNNICKLGDFGLVFDLKCDSYAVAEDGDSKYLAREMLNNPPGKPADIFSLGISILELASDLDLPSRGDGWHILREGQTPEQFMKDISPKLRNLIFLMMEEDPKKRPTAVELFNDPTIQQYLRKRYPANYGVARCTSRIWSQISRCFWLVTMPFYIPVKRVNQWLGVDTLFKKFMPRWKKEEFSTQFSECSGGDAENDDQWRLRRRNESLSMLTCSPTVSEDMDDVGRRPARREVTPEPSPNSRNFTNNDLFTPDSPRHFHDENCSLLVDSDSPISRFVVEENGLRKAMTAPVRRSFFHRLRYEDLRAVPKLNFNLDDDEESAEATASPRPALREVGNRGSSADELEY